MGPSLRSAKEIKIKKLLLNMLNHVLQSRLGSIKLSLAIESNLIKYHIDDITHC